MSVVKCDQQNMVRQVNLAAAFHDHISCTKLPSGICGLEQDNSVDVNDVNQSSQGFTQSDHIYATEKSVHSNDSNQINIGTFEITEMSDQNQIQRLKDMILVQLDLIQHQQEQLLKKDRQLQGLKQDREALCLRLEKMEKRIAVLTSKLAISFTPNSTGASSNNNNNINQTKNYHENSINENQTQTNPMNQFSDSQVFTKIYPKSSSAASSSSTPLPVAKQTQSSNVKNNSQIVKVKKETQDQSEQTSVRKIRKRQSEITSTNSSNNNNNNNYNNNNNNSISNNSCKKKCRSTGTSTTSEFVITDFTAPKINENKTTNETAKPLKTGKKKIAKKCDNSDVNSLNSNSNNSTSNKSIFNPKDFLTTEKPYSVNINCNLDDIVNSPHLKTPKICQQRLRLREIEVPSWRIHQVSSCYSLEGTENLDDDVFNRRHSKLEMDEKRRKRWDIQRLREQRQNEKLRTGRYYNNSYGSYFIEKSDLKRKSCDFSSFFPQPKDVQSIEVTEKLPIIAFGHPIPRLPQKPFSLPWNINCERPAQTQLPTIKSLRNINSKKSTVH